MYIKRFITTIICGLILSTSAFAGSVGRAQFTTDIVDREPVDRVEILESGAATVKYFTELLGLENQTITHQWVYDDTVMFEKSFQVGGPRWRVWTSKSLQPGWTGIWYVHTLDADGATLMTQSFEYR